METVEKDGLRVVFGRVLDNEGSPLAWLKVTAMDADLFIDDVLGEATTDDSGGFRITYGIARYRDLFERAPDVYVVVCDAKGHPLVNTRSAMIRNAGHTVELIVHVPSAAPPPRKPTISVGGVDVDPHVFERLESANVLDWAELAIQGRGNPEGKAALRALSPELDLDQLAARYCFTPLVRFLRETIERKRWPRAVRLRFEEVLTGYDPEAAYATYDTAHFSIGWNDSGGDQPPSADTNSNITMPGSGAVVGATVGGNGVPDYIEKLGFWLENAYSVYTTPPFALRDPVTSGRIPVSVTGTSAGSAGGGAMTIGRSLNDDLLAAVPTHELMHLIQERYEAAGTTGSWSPGMVEGGAVLGEDVVFDTHNRYIVQATTTGTLVSTSNSLFDSSKRYELALFLKYISEQQSSRVNAGDEPAIGVETYRALLEQFDASGYNSTALATAIGNLPWYQSLHEFGYLDAARQDETSSETLLGNFWLALYLKDLGVNDPDRRFDFLEDEEDATWDTIFQGSNSVTTLGALTLTNTSTLNTGGNLAFTSTVQPFAARHYKVNVNNAVDTLRIELNAGVGFTRTLIQVALVEPGGVVRDIIRTDRTSWTRTIASLRGATRLDHVLVVVAGTDVGGSFTLNVRDVVAAPDVMVTRWHHAAGTSFEIDSFGWAWTWVSPDVWVDNDGDGLADSEVFFNQDNRLYIRLRNQGLTAASNISVQFWYQNAAAGLSDAGWLPVEDAASVPQSLTGLSLAAGATDQWAVAWAPVPSGGSKHFCIRAVVTVPGDPNSDNKRVLSNFGNVVAASPYIDLTLVRRAMLEQDIRIDVIPRAHGRFVLSAADIRQAEATRVAGGREVTDVFRLRRRRSVARKNEAVQIDPEFLARRRCAVFEKGTRPERRPDPVGHYPTDQRALPPGWEKAELMTLAHVADGRVLGGFTWAIWEKR